TPRSSNGMLPSARTRAARAVSPILPRQSARASMISKLKSRASQATPASDLPCAIVHFRRRQLSPPGVDRYASPVADGAGPVTEGLRIDWELPAVSQVRQPAIERCRLGLQTEQAQALQDPRDAEPVMVRMPEDLFNSHEVCLDDFAILPQLQAEKTL